MPAVLHVPAFEDNYIWIVRTASDDRVAVVDPGDADPVFAFLGREGLELGTILCTHHHGDHAGGIKELSTHHPVPVYGPAAERIGGVTRPVREGDVIALDFLELSLRVQEVPGHTRGHVAYEGAGLLFCGDTLFSAGCGRLFEGTAAQMHRSLGRLSSLPADTAVYCAHEYTLANLRFANAVEPENQEILDYQEDCRARLRAGEPTLPSTIGLERRVNPFLRTSEPTVIAAAEAHAGRKLPNGTDVFAEIRRWKDAFRR